MKITFLGTSSATPTRRRNVSALAFQPDQRSEWWLFDCGEGTQHQVLRAPVTLPRLRRIFITHLHGDHCFGLPGLLASRALQGAPEPVDLYGPRGINDFIASIRRACGLHLPYTLTIHEVAQGVIFEDDEFVIRAVAVVHAGQTYSHIIDEKPQAGRFRIEEAKALSLPPGPLYGRLKRGEKGNARRRSRNRRRHAGRSAARRTQSGFDERHLRRLRSSAVCRRLRRPGRSRSDGYLGSEHAPGSEGASPFHRRRRRPLCAERQRHTHGDYAHQCAL